MSTLNPYFGPHSGMLKIWLGIFQVGTGTFAAFSSFLADFSGSYSALGHSGTFAIEINLTDQNNSSAAGPCQIKLNGQTDANATYQIANQKLIITTALNSTPIDIYPSNNGTQVDNISGHNIWIG
jgi:hypothetical protein